MAVPQNRQQLLDAIEREYRKLDKELAGIPAVLVNEKSLEGHAKGTLMSVHDLIAYLVGWNVLVLKWHEGRRAGREVDFPETGFKWNELGRLAQKFYADYEDVPFERLVERLAAAKDEILAVIAAHDDNALYGVAWYEKWTMGRMIQFNTSSPYANASGRLRKWKRDKGLR